MCPGCALWVAAHRGHSSGVNSLIFFSKFVLTINQGGVVCVVCMGVLLLMTVFLVGFPMRVCGSSSKPCFFISSTEMRFKARFNCSFFCFYHVFLHFCRLGGDAHLTSWSGGEKERG